MNRLVERMMEAQKRQRESQTRLISHESNMVVLTNNSGITLDHGDVVVINSAIDSSVDVANSAGQQGPLVVVSGDVVGSATKCAYVGYGTINVTCDGDAIAPGDAVGTSATPTYGAKLATPTIQTILGIATTSKGVGLTADVTIIVLAGGGAATGGAGGGGWRYATVVVAASNSTPLNKASADYVCDGTADQDTINSAVGLCIDRGGGKVVLLEGDYILSGSIYLADHVHIQGMGNSTVLYMGNLGITFSVAAALNDVRLSDMQVVFTARTIGVRYVVSSTLFSVTDLVVENLTVVQGYRGISLTGGGDRITVRGCTFIQSYYALYLAAAAASPLSDILIAGNHFYYCARPAVLTGDAIQTSATHATVKDVSFDGNTVLGSYDYYNPAMPPELGFSIWACGAVSFTGNSIVGLQNGIIFRDSFGVTVAGNSFRSLYGSGVQVTSSVQKSGETTITGNTFAQLAWSAVETSGYWQSLYTTREEDPDNSTVISSNICMDCLYTFRLHTTSRLSIVDNIVKGDQGYALELIDCWEALIADNYITHSYQGMWISETADDLQIQGNYLIELSAHGMEFISASNCSVLNNCFFGIGTSLSDTYDAIHMQGAGIYGGCDHFLIQGNFMRPGFAYDVPTARYGINLSTSACEDNIIAWNDLRDFALSGEINDSGTGTWISQYQAAGGITLGTLADYTEVEPDGTLHFNGDATVWDDLRVGSYGMRPGGTPPDFINSPAFAGDSTIYYFAFNGAGIAPVEEMFFDVQVPHGYKVGSDIYAHVHFAPTSTNGGDLVSRTVRFKLTYTWASIGATFPGTATIDMDTSFVPNTSLWDHLMSEEVQISGAGKGASSMLVCRLYRDPADGDDYPQDVALLEMDFHFEMDTVGSRQQSSK